MKSSNLTKNFLGSLDVIVSTISNLVTKLGDQIIHRESIY